MDSKRNLPLFRVHSTRSSSSVTDALLRPCSSPSFLPSIPLLTPHTHTQIEAHPYWRNDALLGWCRERGIHVTAFSPLGSPDSASIFPRKLPLDLLRDERVLAVAAACGKNAGQVLIRWALQHGTSVIPKSTSPARIAGNLQVCSCWRLFFWGGGPAWCTGAPPHGSDAIATSLKAQHGMPWQFELATRAPCGVTAFAHASPTQPLLPQP